MAIFCLKQLFLGKETELSFELVFLFEASESEFYEFSDIQILTYLLIY